MSNALERIQKYIAERKKSRGIDHEHIHGLHAGDEREAMLLLSDLESMVAELNHYRSGVEVGGVYSWIHERINAVSDPDKLERLHMKQVRVLVMAEAGNES